MSHRPPSCHCSIAPPDLLARLAIHGTIKQRTAAVQALATSAAFRQQRAVVGRLSRQFNISVPSLSSFTLAATRKLTVYDNQKLGRTFLPGTRKRGWGDPPTPDRAVNEAYDGSAQTYDFFRQVLGRNSLDGNGMELISSVHYGVSYDNAFWDGTQMVYGDGSGQIFQRGGLTRALDVMAHELTHGVTEYTAGLEYSTQSGALNESFSDVFGSLVKQHSLGQTAQQADWLIGEGILVPALGTALRSLRAPGTAYSGDRQPGHMRDYVELPDDNDPRNDNGGVHINSGIPNHAFYLAATTLGGEAWEQAGKIWYETLTSRLHPTSQFTEAARATVEVATLRFGADVAAAVHDAWSTVGVL